MLGSWLAAWIYFLDVSLGSLAVLLMHRLTGGVWILPIERYLRAALVPLPLLSILFVPVLFASFHLFPWSTQTAPGGPMSFKTAYLAAGPFIARSLIALAAWCLLAWRLRGRRAPGAGLCAAGLIVIALSVTWSAVDWIGSLEPQWSSSILGLVDITAQGLAAVAFVTLCLTWRRTPEPPGAEECGDLGNLLLTFVMTWAYLAFVQFLIIWAEDLPRETNWYLPRVQQSWVYLSLIVVCGQFALPFALLLFRRLKRDPRGLALIAALLLLAHAGYVFWLIVPSLAPQGWNLAWTDPVALVCIGVPWVYLVSRDLARATPGPGLPAPDTSPHPGAVHVR
ncbi:MAG: hypothetical protein U1F35_04390 [Steroidobacteraceae bacterium]